MEYLPIISIFIAVAGFLFQQFSVISGLKERLAALETKMDLFWKGIEKNVIGMLKTYPTDIDKDILLDKMARGELTQDEAERLRTVLIGEMDKMTNGDAKKIIYILALGRLEQVLFDIKKTLCKI